MSGVPTFSTDLSGPTAAAVAQRGTPATLNLDDIFGDVMFTPDGDTVFMSEDGAQGTVLNSGEREVSTMARKRNGDRYIAVQRGGGVQTTQLLDNTKPSLVMGTADGAGPTQSVPFRKAPQQRHHLQYAMPKKKSSRSSDRKMSEAQKNERRERNREHAKRSRIRKKFLLESLQQSVALLKEENEKLRGSIRDHLGDGEAQRLLAKPGTEAAPDAALIAASQGAANKVLDDPDFSFIKALQTAQQNFVVTDPSLPDNPIVYASQGFLNLTGYSLDQILGRNCRFLQGPETDPKAVERIRHAIEQGNDLSVCLLNYRVDGTTFWNQFFIAALRDAAGNITNFVGVQCKVSDQYAASVTKQQEEEEDQPE
uniref:LOV domain-containing protein n=1 Tax=Craspedostauros australis TaxID=1486917 RepID=A0A7R9WT84_9STRA|mmetsp:Transcript_19879/g.55287  ORF Transcript_19879/g.55287 Transcript_19879/m.55287 type:complete len:368 (+) Transcript_19879:249-1352(+)|eukprot:CAMPEP_0198112554 /NCGR_PEP_ID=MMETSP1442-20131203/4389_1 /TAXON_ID= /ORGANISM="Craspedostauros australis, Strain CCMP3328" /LENGTH=367 /DNA_ID=CAMNT_0043769369 /DNA_START=184 /DNA_END=1287 /DNA_ORIENTATION=+